MNPTSNKSDFEDLTTNLKDLAYAYLEKYNPSKQQLKVYLLKKYLTKIKGTNSKKEVTSIIDEIIFNLEKKRILNDEMYSDSKARMYLRRGYSLNKINQSLRNKGIDNKYIKQSLDKIKDDEIEPDDICYENYRPPENMIRLEITKKSDIWCLGCIFYELLTGEYLFNFETEANLNNVNLQEQTEETDCENLKDSISSSESTDSQHQHIMEIYRVCSSEEEERINNIKKLLSENLLFTIDETIIDLITEVLVAMLDCNPNTRKHAYEILKMNLFKPFVYDNLQLIDTEV